MDSSIVKALFVTTDDDGFTQLGERLSVVTNDYFELARATNAREAAVCLQKCSFDLCVVDERLLEDLLGDDILQNDPRGSNALLPTLTVVLYSNTRKKAPGLQYLKKSAFRKNEIDSLLRIGVENSKLRRELEWRQSYERLLNHVIRRAANLDPNNIDRGVNRILARIGNFLEADRAYVCLFSPTQNAMTNTHEWCARGIPSQIHRVIDAPLSNYRWFASQICSRSVVHLPSMGDLPETALAERKEFHAVKVKSMVCVPLVRRRQAVGFLGLSAVRQNRSWSEQEIELLCTVGKVCVNAVERKRADDSLRESENRFRNVLDSLNDGLLITTEEGLVDYVNSRFTELTGYSEERVLGRNSFEVLLDDAQLRSLLDHHEVEDIPGIAASPKVYELEVQLDDGKRQWLEVKAGPYRNRRGQPLGTISALADVTERKRLETQLVHSQKMEAVGRLAGGVAHDFNNLLTAVLGYSGLLLNRLPPEHPFRRELLQIRKASEQASTLIQQLLTFSRKQVIEPTTVNVNSVVEETTSMLIRLIGEDIDLVTRLQAKAATVRLDPGQLQQIILNLAINARDVMPEGGTLTIQTRQLALEEASARKTFGLQAGQYVSLEVIDTGAGMTEEVKQRLFEPFFTTKEQGKGTGLGLSTVYGIVKQVGGAIEVESKIGRGSLFRILLPYESRVGEANVQRMKRQQIIAGDETVLLVEDEDTVRNLLKEVLEMSGYTVLGARHGRQALRVAERYRGTIHMVVTDVVMPYLGGRQLIERLKYLRPEIKTLVISGYLNKLNELNTGSQNEFGSFLSKPFTPYEFSQRIRDLLDSSQDGSSGSDALDSSVQVAVDPAVAKKPKQVPVQTASAAQVIDKPSTEK